MTAPSDPFARAIILIQMYGKCSNFSIVTVLIFRVTPNSNISSDVSPSLDVAGFRFIVVRDGGEMMRLESVFDSSAFV